MALLRLPSHVQPLFEHRLEFAGFDTFDFERIRCPVLLVWGAADRMLPHTDARMALDALPTTQVELIEDCGHHPQLEATGRLAELLLPFGT